MILGISIFIATTKSERIKVTNNSIIGSLVYGIYVVGYDATKRAKNITVIGNIIKDVTQLGIRLQYIDTAVVSVNEVLNVLSGQEGFSLSTFKNGTLNGNIVVGATGATYGRTISGAGDGYSTLIGNRISGCTTGIGVLSSADDYALIGNIITGATTAVDALGSNNIKINNIVA